MPGVKIPIATPGRLNKQAEFYRQLASLTSAGIGVVNALTHLQKHPPSPYEKELAGKILLHLETGMTFADALDASGPEVPIFDRALLRAGEQSGRLDGCFNLIAGYYADRARMTRQVLADLSYPLFLLHFAVLILPFPELFQSGNILLYAAKVLGVLVPLYGCTYAVLYSLQGRHSEEWRAKLERYVSYIPFFGKARQNLALARLSAALGALLSAGVSVVQAWPIAAAASGSPALRRAVARWQALLEQGLTPAEALRASPEFPTLFSSLYSSGEISGKLDHELVHLHEHHQEEGNRQLHLFSSWLPKIIYFVIMLVIAYKVLTFWLNYFQTINSIGG